MTMKKYLFLFFLLLTAVPVFANVDTVKVPIYRQLFHDRINEEQRLLDRMDGKIDGIIKATHKPEINLAITDVMVRKIDLLQNGVEGNERMRRSGI